MKVKFTGIVREIKVWDTDKDKKPLPPEKWTDQITFLDRETGGDVVITFPHDHNYKVGPDYEVDLLVKPQVRNFKLSLYAQPVNTPVQTIPSIEPEKPKK